MTRVSRRDFVRLGAAGVAVPWVLEPHPVRAATITAQEVVDRIRKSLGVEWQADTVDTFKAGDSSTLVTGIATTSLATIDVMRRAVKAGATYETAPNSHRFTIPETTLGRLAADVKKRLGARALRVVGDPNARVSRIQLGVGYATPSVNDAAVDVVISGEQQEVDGGCDNPEYVLDAAALGIPKGWITDTEVIDEICLENEKFIRRTRGIP